MSIQAIRSNSKPAVYTNRFAVLAIEDELPVTAPAAPPAAPPAPPSPPTPPVTVTVTAPPTTPTTFYAPRRAYMPPNMRRNTAPVAQRPQRVLPNTQSITDFPSLGGAITTAVATTTTGNNWATKAKEWAAHDELTAEQDQEHKRAAQRQEEENTYIGIPRFTPFRRYVPPKEDDDIVDNIDEAEAYVGGYNHTKYAAYDYEESAEPSHTPPYSPTPW